MRFIVGIDLTSCRDIAEALARHGDRYLERVFTEREIVDSGADPSRLAACFAVKEAVTKLLRPGADDALPWRDIGLEPGPDGAPAIALAGAARALADRRGITDVTLSHASRRGDAALAVVLARTAETGR